jgi:hypothetical protein
MRAVRALADRHRRAPLTAAALQGELDALRAQFGFRELRLVRAGQSWRVHAEMNPNDDVPLQGGRTIEVEGYEWDAFSLENGDVVLVQAGTRLVLRSGDSVSSKLVAVLRTFFGEEAANRAAARRLTQEGNLAERLPEAERIARAVLIRSGALQPQMLVSFASVANARRGAPEAYLTRLGESDMPMNPMAAFDRPASAAERAAAVQRGQEEGASILSDVGLVFEEIRPGQYTESRSATGIGIREFMVRRGGSYVSGQVSPLGIIRVNAEGTVIEVIRTFGRLTRERFIEILRRRWTGRVAENLR